MTESQWVVLTIALVVIILLFMVVFLDYEVIKLRRDNKLLRRVLEDYFRLEDGSKRTTQAILQEADYASQISPEWWP